MANKTITEFTESGGMSAEDELLVWDASSSGTRKVPRSALYRLPTLGEAEDGSLTDVTAWNALRIKQLFDAQLEASNDVLRAIKSIKEGRGGGGVITGNTAVAQTVVTFSAAHHLIAGDVITITDSDSTQTLDGSRTVVSVPLAPVDAAGFATTIIIAVNVTVPGTAGFAIKDSGATLADDSDMQILMEPAAIYHISGVLNFSFKMGEVGGFRWNLSYPPCDELCLKTHVFSAPNAQAGSPNYAVTTHYLNILERGGATTTLAADEGDITPGSGVVSVLNFSGQIDGGVAGGLFKFRWAQFYADYNQCFMWPGSEIRFVKLS